MTYSIKDKISQLQGNQTADIRKPEMSIEDYYDDPLSGYSFNNKYNIRNSEIDISKPFYGITIGDSFSLDSNQLEQFNIFTHAFSWISSLFGKEETPTQLQGTYVKLAYLDSSVSQETKENNEIKNKTLCVIDNTILNGADAIPAGKLVKVEFLDYNLTNGRIIGVADRTSNYEDLLKNLASTGSGSIGDAIKNLFDFGSSTTSSVGNPPPGDYARGGRCVNPKYAPQLERRNWIAPGTNIQISRKPWAENVVNKQIGNLYYVIGDLMNSAKLPARATATITSTPCWRNLATGTAFHPGYDIGAGCGELCYAAANGVIVTIAYLTTSDRPCKGGKIGQVIIEHTVEKPAHGLNVGDKFYTAYLHLVSHAAGLSVGSNIAAGQTVGKCGATGPNYPPHLHFECRTTKNWPAGSGGKAGSGGGGGEDYKIFAFVTPGESPGTPPSAG